MIEKLTNDNETLDNDLKRLKDKFEE